MCSLFWTTIYVSGFLRKPLTFFFFIVNIYDVLIIDICWFCKNPKFIFKGTEDMIKEYHNYWFHIKESLIGEVLALVICAIVGLVIQFIL